MPETILIIDDDQKLTQLLKKYLSDFGFNVITASHPEIGLTKLKNESPHLIILDIMLPDIDGFKLCKIIRKSSSIPIIMLTARGDVTDRVVGLELGADDYLAKPFEPRELVARIQSVLRRIKNAPDKAHDKTLIFDKLKIDVKRQRVKVDEREVILTTHEFAALALLVKHTGKVLSRDDILNELSGIDCDAFNRSVDITMSRLRKKLHDDPKDPSYIKTVWGAGYVFIGVEK